MLLLASSSTWSPSAVAVPTGAQKWLREPVSDQASVVRWRPAAISRRMSSGPCCSTSVVPA